jgi:arginyl-tRNA synthetase
MKEELKKIIRNAGVDVDFDLSVPPKAELGDYAFACFDYAKVNQLSPVEAAQKLASLIVPTGFVQEVKAFGPYLNFFLKPAEVQKLIITKVLKEGKKYGANQVGANKNILVEYPSNNTHKELHIGHLRNICIGNSLVKIFEQSGFKVIPVNYINDFGAHVAKCLWGLQKFHKTDTPPENKQKWLGQIYAEASRYLKDHPEHKNEIQELQQHLEAKDKKIWPLYIKTRAWSLEQFELVFKELGITHKKTFFEKDIKHLGQKIVDELLEQKVATVGEGGAIIIDLNNCGLEVALLRKSDGTGLYLTADLGLALLKNKFYPNISESIHITGTEQNLYFKQLFKVLELAGYKFRMTHIGYGLVNLPTGKMSSREGTVVLYDDVKKSVYDQVFKATSERHTDWSLKKIKQTVNLITLAAIKFDFLKHESAKLMVFDPSSAASF